MAKKTTTKAASDKKKNLTKAEVMTALSESTGLQKRDVSRVIEELGSLIGRQLGKRGPGTFVVPGLLKLRVVRKPATKARKGVNPFTGEEIMIKAKPARNAVKISALKTLKEMV